MTAAFIHAALTLTALTVLASHTRRHLDLLHNRIKSAQLEVVHLRRDIANTVLPCPRCQDPR